MDEFDRQMAWENFTRTGRVEDYLDYVKTPDTSGGANTGKDVASDAVYNRRDRHWFQQFR